MLIEHIEHNLGKINYSWKLENANINVSVLEFINTPSKNVSTYVTLGLSNYTLFLENDKTIYQELIFLSDDFNDREDIASFLLTFSETMIKKQFGLSRGEVVNGNTPIIKNTALSSLYATIPILQNESFIQFNGHVPVVFVWIIPVFSKEANYIKSNGWNHFEEMLDSKNCEYWNLKRVEIDP